MLAAFRNMCVFCLTIGLLPAGLPALAAQAAPPDAAGRAADILQTAGFRGGMIVHLGAADPRLLAALGAEEGRLVHGLDADSSRIEQARRHLRSLGIHGRVSVDLLTGGRLPYIDNLVNLLIVEDTGDVPQSEMMRVLAPRGVACVRRDGRWTTFEKPRPEQIDDWTHFLYDSTNNAVSQDETIAPLRRMQWVGSPRWARHHDHMSSLSALVSSAGRLFYIFDEGSTTSILLPSRWSLIARDAFNGTVLWKRPIEHWHTQLWPLKSGPALLTRRLVAVDDAVYVTLGLHGPLTMLDAATGETRRTFEGTEATEEIVVRDGTVYVVVNRSPEETWGTYDSIAAVRRGVQGAQWSGGRKAVMALDPESGEVLWEHESFVAPSTLAVDTSRVYFHNGQTIVALGRTDGAPQWQSEPMPIWAAIHSWYTPTLVVYDDVVLWSGGETMVPHRGARNTMYAVAAATGKTLWSAPHAPSGYQSAEDLLVAGGLVWTGATTSGGYDGIFYGHDPHTGEVKKQFAPGVEPYWFHHRCYRGKATENFLLMSRTGIEFLDIERESWELHHWVRGACLTGILPANGLVYAPPHDCACYPEAKVFGFAALAPASAAPEAARHEESDAARLSQGPAYADVQSPSPPATPQSEAAWPTYRADATRSGYTPAALPAELKPAWQTALGGRLSALSIADGKVYVAAVDDHTVHALHAETGEPVWSYTAGGRVDSPPTLWRDLCLFGSADGRVYCLRAADGELVWRFRAAPIDRRHTNFEQVESVWPVHGSVLVQDGVVYAVAGRSMFLDGGLHWYQLDARSGELLAHRRFDDTDPASGESLQMRHEGLQMPVALPDILSSDGRHVYMRSQVFDLEGNRLDLGPHTGDMVLQAAEQRGDRARLFAPYGFLDGSWFHRSYWVFGRSFAGGWGGYYQAGKFAPAGRLLVADAQRVYGYGRQPKYLRWTTPINYHLFATDRQPPELPEVASWAEQRRRSSASMIEIEKSESLNPANKPLVVEAWVKAERPAGAMVARGAHVQGYVLFLHEGRPHFGVRVGEEAFVAAGKERVVGDWVHLAGVLRADKRLEIYVNGKPAGSAEAGGLIPVDPHQAMSIGADGGSGEGVADYRRPFPFNGLIDQVRVYHGELTPEEIGRHAADPKNLDAADAQLVLHYTFENGRPRDLSGNDNHGKPAGVKPAEGKWGRALQFTGRVSTGVAGHFVEYDWSHENPPLVARAMVLAGRTLLVAGPPDFVDEDQAAANIADPAVVQKLAEQDAALRGERGAMLLAVSADDGAVLARYPLDSPPAWDGMAAAEGRLFLSTLDGKVVCWTGQE